MPAPVPPNPPPKRPPAPRMPTRLESADEIRAAIQARQAELLGGPPPLPAAAMTARPAEPAAIPATVAVPGSHIAPFKPTRRPPMALLHVFDDGADDGEVIRLRGERFVIGRSEGDLVIPHDCQISGRHAELVRQRDEDGRWLWVLTDLGSTNGTFVRAGAAVLKEGQEFLIGRTRYRFEAANENPAPGADATGSPKATVAWNSGANLPVPAVVELTLDGPGGRVPLIKPEYWIGSDRAACAISPADDPFVSPRHARLSLDAKGRWHLNNNKSANGVWVRIDQMELTGSCYFQLGEQRFSFKVP
jgi:hypothetical protein